QTAEEMANELARYLRGASIKSKPAGLASRIAKRVKRHKVISALASSIILLALAFLANIILSSEKIKQSQEEIEKSQQAQQDIRIEAKQRNYKYYDNIRLAKDFLSHPGGLGANLDTTLILLDEAASLFPERPEAHLYLGKIYTVQGDGRRALEEFNRAVEYGPDSCEVYLERALFLLEQGRQLELDMAIDLGFSDLKKALKLDSENASVAYHIAQTLYDCSSAIDLQLEERRRLASMAHNFAKKAQNLGSTADVECLLAQTFLEFIKYSTSDIERTTNLDSAHEHVLKALELDKNHLLACTLQQEMKKMREKPDLEPGDAGAWEFITETGLTHAKRISDMVIDGFEKTWSETERTEILNNVMNFLISPDPVVSLAARELEAAVDSELDLDYPALLEKASTYTQQGNWSSAITCYEKALVLNPTQAHELNFNIADAYHNLNELGLALQHARLAYSQDPDNIRYLDLLGKILLALEDNAGFEILYNEAKKNGYLSLLGWKLPSLDKNAGAKKKEPKAHSNMLELRFP
ncbi:MAG: tetratricopeptide repeat protein, partial [Planctomycetota bacterium]